MSAWDGCAPPPAASQCSRRHVDPAADTIGSPEGVEVISVSLRDGLVRREATEADMRHCASCTCPVKHSTLPGERP